MKISILGAGAIGMSLAALLTAREEVTLVVKTRERAEELNGEGILFNGVRVPVKACTAEEATPCELAVLATKQRDTAGAISTLGKLMEGGGVVLTVQNGLPELPLIAAFGADRVYGCALSYGAERVPGGVKLTSDAVHFALCAAGKGEKLPEIERVFSAVGQTSVGDLYEIRFAKLATNASFSTLSALSGLPFGEIAKKYKRYALALIREVFAVARAYGCRKLPLNGHDLYKVFGAFAPLTLPIAMKPYRYTRSGMLLDLEAGRRCDVDYVAGACVNAGREKGVETPCLARAVALVHDVENGLAEIAPETLGLIFEENI